MSSVCGVVVTFNPQANVEGNLARLSPQVDSLIVVDNGSVGDSLARIREAADRQGFSLFENNKNLGIAAALNRGVLAARSAGAEFVALFDQDSLSEPNLIRMLLETYRKSLQPNIAIVSARHTNFNTGGWRRPIFAPDGGPFVAITSGSLIPSRVLEECGLFEEGLIIDRVDEEFCLRVRSRGYSIVHCERGILWVAVGEPSPFRVFGKTLFFATHYSVGRRYYITRNRLVIVRRYWRKYPKWCLSSIYGLLKELVFIVLAENDRTKKIKIMLRGVSDAISNRMGMRVPL